MQNTEITPDIPCVVKTLFDPIALSKKTEALVIRGNKRKYLRFGHNPDYTTGVATGYAVGCNLRCAFCWANETRDNLDLAKDFYSPQEVFDILLEITRKKPKIKKMRISNGETTIGRDHLLEFAELVEKSDIELFAIETNGIILGTDESFVKELAGFKKSLVRVGLKAGTPEDFSRKTGAIPEAFDLPFNAIRYLQKHKANYWVSAMSADPRFMSPLERASLITELGKIDPMLILKLQEEVTYLFPVAEKLLTKLGYSIYHQNVPWFLRGRINKYLQISYEPISKLSKRKLSLKYTLKNLIQLRHGI